MSKASMTSDHGSMKTYLVTVTHPLLDGPFSASCAASSPDRAERRVRMTMVHLYRHVQFLDEGHATVQPDEPVEQAHENSRDSNSLSPDP